MALRGTLAAEKDTARAEIQLDDVKLITLGTPPLTQALRLRKRLKHKFPWRIESTRDNVFDFVCIHCDVVGCIVFGHVIFLQIQIIY
jgi:predicted dithiol-disulfide oxidoreductase (DUF899 family)